jgi:hypothetical protein
MMPQGQQEAKSDQPTGVVEESMNPNLHTNPNPEEIIFTLILCSSIQKYELIGFLS